VLASFGIATIGIEPWFIPILVIFLFIGLWGFWQSARTHGAIWTFVVAIVSSAAVVVGRWFEFPVVMWGGTVALMAAYVSDWMIKKKASI
jgi:hypothetical protein